MIFLLLDMCALVGCKICWWVDWILLLWRWKCGGWEITPACTNFFLFFCVVNVSLYCVQCGKQFDDEDIQFCCCCCCVLVYTLLLYYSLGLSAFSHENSDFIIFIIIIVTIYYYYFLNLFFFSLKLLTYVFLLLLQFSFFFFCFQILCQGCYMFLLYYSLHVWMERNVE